MPFYSMKKKNIKNFDIYRKFTLKVLNWHFLAKQTACQVKVNILQAVIQQSAVAEKKLGQLLDPHSRFPAHSSSASQSPSKSPHGFKLEQHDHLFSVVQLHPAKLGSGSKNNFDYMSLLIIRPVVFGGFAGGAKVSPKFWQICCRLQRQ